MRNNCKWFLLLFGMFSVTGVLAQPQQQKDYRWNLGLMQRMDTLDLWCGGRSGDLTISNDLVDGHGSVAVEVDIDGHEYTRIEHQFLDGFHDVGLYLHGFNIHEENFASYKTIRFSCKTDFSGPADLAFRLWDTHGDWVEWKVLGIHAFKAWQPLTLAVDSQAASLMNLSRVSSVLLEVQAQGKPVKGQIWLDQLELLPEAGKGVKPLTRPKTYAPCDEPIHSLPVAAPAAQKDIHILMFCDLVTAFDNADPNLAIRLLQDSIARFRGMHGIEFWFLAAEYRGEDRTPAVEKAERQAKLRETLLTVAHWCQANRVPFYVGLGHIAPIVVKADLLAETLDAAPGYCKGAFLHEFSPEGNNQKDEMLDLLEVLRKKGKVLILNNQTCYWFSLMLPHNTEYRNQVHHEKYKDVFVPMWENLLPGAQGLCLGGCLGFWQGGRASQWGASCQSWTYANLNYGWTDQMPDHWWLRMLVSSVALGATYIEIEPDWPFNGKHLWQRREGGYLLKLGNQDYLPFYADSEEMRALRWFCRLLGDKALLPAVSPESLASLPSVALQVVPGPNPPMATGLLRRATDDVMNQSHCPTAWEMSCQPPRNDIFRRLYGSMNYFDQTFPITSLGLVSVLPPENSPPGIQLLKTDGKDLLVDGQWIDAQKAEPLVYQAFAQAAEKLPFTAAACTISVIQLNDREYQVVLMDPEERFCIGLTTTLKTTLKGNWRVRDAVSGERLGEISDRMSIDIPAGGFRILRVAKGR